MLMKKSCIKSERQGVASLYVVIFATILFGVITLSFTRIILSEVEQSSDDDLSQSAYDAALAGVEDAKIAVNRYFNCLNANGSAAACSNINVFSNDTNCEDGFPLGQILHGVDGEVKIQESRGGAAEETAADQAYTCVIISDVTQDYRGVLTSDTRTKVVPIGINATGGATDSSLGQVAKVRFSWYSELNQGTNNNSNNNTFKNLRGDNKLDNADHKTTPPTVQLNFIKTGNSVNINEFRTENNTANTIDSTMVFIPAQNGDNPKVISHNEILSNGNVANSANDGASNMHSPYTLKCSSQQEFACVVELDVSAILHNGDNAFLVVSLPYGDSLTDFSVALLDSSGNPINFRGVQVNVDSTGRTNQLLRRVETRLDPADLYFPYPQFALETESGDDDAVRKNFWITSNCWTEKGYCDNNGEL